MSQQKLASGSGPFIITSVFWSSPQLYLLVSDHLIYFRQTFLSAQNGGNFKGFPSSSSGDSQKNKIIFPESVIKEFQYSSFPLFCACVTAHPFNSSSCVGLKTYCFISHSIMSSLTQVSYTQGTVNSEEEVSKGKQCLLRASVLF